MTASIKNKVKTKELSMMNGILAICTHQGMKHCSNVIWSTFIKMFIYL